VGSPCAHQEAIVREIFKPSEIKQHTIDRAVLEVEMCRELYGIYNSHPIIGEIREIIATAFESLVAHVILPGKYTQKGGAADEAIKEGKILQVFAKHGGGPPTGSDLGDKCRAIVNAWQQWDATDCSDLSRLIGSVLEKAKGTPGEDWGDFSSQYTKYKPDQFYKNDSKAPGRSRTVKESDVSFTVPHSKGGRDAGLNARVMIRDSKTSQVLDSGISPFRLMPHSTVRKIDIAFGLPEGADISGTTSDSIIVNQLVARFAKATSALPSPPLPSTSKLLQLLPMVTMISHGHHTLLESALTLTLFGVCEYQIGFYTSLFTGATVDAPKYDANNEILKVLKKYENDKRNQHILCWHDGPTGKYAAMHYDTPEDVKKYRKFATTGEGFLKFFRHNVHDRVYKADLEPLVSGRYKESRRVII
jgi:hypothetical protein